MCDSPSLYTYKMDKKFTITSFEQAKKAGRKISMLTAYDYSMAKLVDDAGIDCILVGDSLGMVMLGYDSTIPVTVEDIIHHAKAVRRGTKRAFIVADMPFMSFHVSVEDAVRNAGRIIKESGVEAIKMEGGVKFADTVRAIVRAQIPVMGHIGLTPQSVNVFGGFKVQGKTIEAARQLIEDAKALEEAGAFAITLEGIPAEIAEIITQTVRIPTIGIGAGTGCDGQVLVVNDMLGMFSDLIPKFVKHFVEAGEVMQQGIRQYISDVQEGTFPAKENTYTINQNVLNDIKNNL